MRLPRGGNREDVPPARRGRSRGAPGGFTLRARRSRGEATEQAGQRHRKAGVRRPTGEGEERFWRVAEISRRQSAKSLELRAVTSLSGLWQNEGKKEEARQMLAEVYNWFTEGFDTKDLQEAKALLAELAEERP
jgi:predicted ATPase